MISELLPWKKKENHLLPSERRMDPIQEFHKQFDDLFNNFFEGSGLWPEVRSRGENFIPRFEVSEADDRINVTAELPGVEEKDLDVSVSDGVLCVRGEKRSESEGDDKGCHFSERSYGSFQRSFALPDGIELDKVEAKFNNGILKIALPKDKAKRENVRKISVTHG